MGLRAKFFAAFSIGIFLLLLQTVVSSGFISQLQIASTNLSQAAKNGQAIDYLSNAVKGMRSTLTMVLDGDISPKVLETLPVYHQEYDKFMSQVIEYSRFLNIESELQAQLTKNYNDMEENYKNLLSEIDKNDEDMIIETAFFLDDILAEHVETLSIYNNSLNAFVNIAIEEEKNIRNKPLIYGFIILGIASAVSIIIALFLSSYFVNIVKKLAQKANEIANGDLSGGPLAVKGKDEFSNLATSINTMEKNLHDLLESISKTFKKLASSANNLSDSTQRMHVQIDAETQQVTTAFNAIVQLEKSSQRITEFTQETLQTTKTVIQETNIGAEQVLDSSRSVKQLNKTINGVSADVELLADSNKQITSILTVINSITEQTNLLALNAAIEAARAGEYGRGFSVVADEVRTLASRTLTSAKEIEKMIEGATTNSAHVSSSIQEGKAQADITTVSTQRTSECFNDIVVSVNAINQQTSEVSTIISKQESSTKNLSQQLQLIKSGEQEKLLLAKDANNEIHRLEDYAKEIESLLVKFKL